MTWNADDNDALIDAAAWQPQASDRCNALLETQP